MKFLIVNDDSIDAPGIALLAATITADGLLPDDAIGNAVRMTLGLGCVVVSTLFLVRMRERGRRKK